jgi:hypothetical protein
VSAWRERARAALRSPATWIALGMVLRLAHVATLGNRYYFGDTAEYEVSALRLLHGMGLDQSIPRAPLYPMLMALSFLAGGESNYFVMRGIDLGLSLALMVLVSRLAGRLGGPTAAALAAAGTAVAPTLVFAAGLLYPTTLHATLLAGSTLVALELRERPRLRLGVLLGLLFVLGWLTDQVFLVPAGAVSLWLLLGLRSRGAPLARALAVAGLVFAAVALPYVRMQQRIGGGGVFMHKAQAVLHSARTDPILAHDRWVRFPPDTPFEPLSMTGFLRREARLLSREPLAYLHDVSWEFLHFFRPVPDRVQTENRFTRPVVRYAGGIYFLVLLVLAGFGLAFGRGPRAARLLLAGVVLATAAIYSFFFTQTRYRIPVEPQMLVLAALGVRLERPRWVGHHRRDP